MEPNQIVEQPVQLPSTPPQQTTPSASAPTPQPNPSKLPTILLILISLVSLSGLVYFYIQTQSLKQQLVLQPTPTPTISDTPKTQTYPTTDPTANLQTYTNQKYGISFKYPLDWKVTASPTTGDQFNIIVDKKSNKSETGFVPFQISVNMTQNQDGNNFTSLSEAKNHFLKSFESSSVKISDIKIDTKPSVVLTGVLAGPGPGEGQFISYTLIQLDQKILVMQLGNESYQESFNQITSTLKFSN